MNQNRVDANERVVYDWRADAVGAAESDGGTSLPVENVGSDVASIRPEAVRAPTFAAVVLGLSTLPAYSEFLAGEFLANATRRWAHVKTVARRAYVYAVALQEHDEDPTASDLLLAAAWLHDIGHAPLLKRSGCHALDGAKFLAHNGALPELADLVAHHSGAAYEALQRGLRPWPKPRMNGPVADLLDYSDLTTGPSGEVVHIEERVADVRRRYGEDHLVTRSLEAGLPELLETVARAREYLQEAGFRDSGLP